MMDRWAGQMALINSINNSMDTSSGPSDEGNSKSSSSTPVDTAAQSPLSGRGSDQCAGDGSGPLVTVSCQPGPSRRTDYVIPSQCDYVPFWLILADKMWGEEQPSLTESPACKQPTLGDSKPKSDVITVDRIGMDQARSGPKDEQISLELLDEFPLGLKKDEPIQQQTGFNKDNGKLKLRKKGVKLENGIPQPLEDPKRKKPSLFDNIYDENRKKALEAHKMLRSLGLNVDPLYKKLSDTSYHNNEKNHSLNKIKIQEFIKKQLKEKGKQAKDRIEDGEISVLPKPKNN